MDELEKKIRGDLFDLRESWDDVLKIEDLFSFKTPELKKIGEDIDLSVEEGLLEYKRKRLLQTFAFAEDFMYDSRSFSS